MLLWEHWGIDFGTPEHHFGDPGVSWDTPQDTLGFRFGCLLIFDRFWKPLGIHFWMIFEAVSCFSGTALTVRVPGSFPHWFRSGNHMESHAWMCLKHSK